MSPALVLTTVNAPYSQQLDAEQLAYFLLHPAEAEKKVPGHMSSFFGEVEPHLQLEFAEMFNIPKNALVSAATAFGQYSGESYPLSA